jgi:hypothetical protein
MKYWGTTAHFIANGGKGVPVGTVLDLQGDIVAGDNLGVRWKKTANTGTASTRVNISTFNDATGYQWVLVCGEKTEIETFDDLQTLQPEDGDFPKKFICVERANDEYLLQPSDYVALAGDVTFANGRVAALQRNNQSVIDSVEYLIPSDFATLQEAIDATQASTKGQNVQINLLIESGHTEATGLELYDGFYGNYYISSVDAIVPVYIQNNGTEGFDGKGSHFFFKNCSSPVFNCLFDAQYSGGRYAAGITAINSNLHVSSGCGLMNVGMPQLSASPADTLEIQFGYNCLVWNSSKGYLNGAIFSGAASRCLWVSRNSNVTATSADLSGSRADGSVSANDGNIYCTRACWINVEYADISGAGNNGITCTRSYVNAEEADVSGNGGKDITVGRGGRVNAFGTKTTNATGTDYPYTASSLDLGGAQEFNDVSGVGVVYSEQNARWPNRTFATSCIGTKYPDGTAIIGSRGRVSLVYSSSSELTATVTLPFAMYDTDYSCVLTQGSALASPNREAGTLRARGFSTTSVELVLYAETGTFSASDTINVSMQIVGRWK